ncbi:MAG: GTP 3',8-cyclase MoaA [Methanoregulaceae archaeon]
MTLRDTYNRPITNLRVSLTPRCNLNCIYCHSEGEKNPKGEMSAAEIGDIINTAAEFGVRSVKFTGGEPLLRTDLADIISAVPKGIECSMTTNGTLLADIASDLHDAGLKRVNISVDSLDREKYKRISGKDLLPDVISGIEAAIDVGLTPVKLNMVVLDGINDNEVTGFLAYVRNNPDLILQLIELMDFKDCPYHSDLSGLEQDLASRSKVMMTRRMHHRKKYCIDNAEVEVVRPLHNTEFCAFCNRLRVTSDGKLKPCLLKTENHLDIRGKKGEELKEMFREAVRLREPYYK